MAWLELVDSWRFGLGGLDLRRLGAWPWVARAALLAALFGTVLASLYWLALSSMAEELERLEAVEGALHEEYAAKALASGRLAKVRAQSRAVEEAWAAKRLLLPA